MAVLRLTHMTKAFSETKYSLTESQVVKSNKPGKHWGIDSDHVVETGGYFV